MEARSSHLCASPSRHSEAHPIRPSVAHATALVELSLSERFSNPKTMHRHRYVLLRLLRETGRPSYADVTIADARAYITGPTADGKPPANNTVRSTLAILHGFYEWAIDGGHLPTDPTATIGRSIRSSYPALYGKVQSRKPARWLTYEQSFEALVGACQDGTWFGSRDQLAVRFGLLGLRVSEIAALRWRHYRDGVIRLTGKKNRLRTVEPGPTLVDLLDRWRRHYEHELGRPVEDDDPVLVGCSASPVYDHDAGRLATGPRPLAWGTPTTPEAIRMAIRKRGHAAGLGDIAPHDLRRTAAGLMHHARSDDGGHLFDLLDIQKVLDHTDPACTMRSYIDHVNTDAKKRAGRLLD